MPPAIALDLSANELPCPREVRIWIDQLLVSIEALDLQAVEAMLELTKQHHLQDLVPNRVGLWRLRNTNPLRRNYQRRELSWLELKSLVCLTCAMASQMNTILRLLVTTEQQVQERKIEALGLQQNQMYLELYYQRFAELYRSRMRPGLSISPEELRALAKQHLTQLLFCSGTSGEVRLWHCLRQGGRR